MTTAGSSPEVETPVPDTRQQTRDDTLGKEWWTLSPGTKPDLKNWADGTDNHEQFNYELSYSYLVQTNTTD